MWTCQLCIREDTLFWIHVYVDQIARLRWEQRYHDMQNWAYMNIQENKILHLHCVNFLWSSKKLFGPVKVLPLLDQMSSEVQVTFGMTLIATKRGNVPTQSWNGKSAVFLMESTPTSHCSNKTNKKPSDDRGTSDYIVRTFDVKHVTHGTNLINFGSEKRSYIF